MRHFGSSLDVPCPKCGAPIGHQCTLSGNLPRECHIVRAALRTDMENEAAAVQRLVVDEIRRYN